MEPTPQPADHPHGALLSEAHHLLVWLIETLHGVLCRPGASLKTLRLWTREYLTPAEAAMRRALRLLADGLAPIPVRIQNNSAPPPAGQPARAATPRPPLFRLGEPAPRPRTLPLAQRPQISIAGTAPPPPARLSRTPDAAVLQASLLRRLEALERAFADPMRHARRLVRQRCPARRLTLSYMSIPGARARCLAAEGQTLLTRLNDAALKAELRTDTS